MKKIIKMWTQHNTTQHNTTQLVIDETSDKIVQTENNKWLYYISPKDREKIWKAEYLTEPIFWKKLMCFLENKDIEWVKLLWEDNIWKKILYTESAKNILNESKIILFNEKWELELLNFDNIKEKLRDYLEVYKKFRKRSLWIFYNAYETLLEKDIANKNTKDYINKIIDKEKELLNPDELTVRFIPSTFDDKNFFEKILNRNNISNFEKVPFFKAQSSWIIVASKKEWQAIKNNKIEEHHHNYFRFAYQLFLKKWYNLFFDKLVFTAQHEGSHYLPESIFWEITWRNITEWIWWAFTWDWREYDFTETNFEELVSWNCYEKEKFNPASLWYDAVPKIFKSLFNIYAKEKKLDLEKTKLYNYGIDESIQIIWAKVLKKIMLASINIMNNSNDLEKLEWKTDKEKHILFFKNFIEILEKDWINPEVLKSEYNSMNKKVELLDEKNVNLEISKEVNLKENNKELYLMLQKIWINIEKIEENKILLLEKLDYKKNKNILLYFIKYKNIKDIDSIISFLELINIEESSRGDYKSRIVLICEYIWLLLYLNKWKKEEVTQMFKLNLYDLQLSVDNLKKEIKK